MILERRYIFKDFSHFMLIERGKARPIDSPHVHDRQLEKVYTKYVLLPLYSPSMIYNNGASLPNKGFAFSKNQLKKELRDHYRRYGREGGIILADGKKFFPSADHGHIRKRHTEFIFNEDLRYLGDEIVCAFSGKKGVPLGVESSQAEMIAYPSEMDNYMKCQVGLEGYGHYMDDFYALVPPNVDYHNILDAMARQAKRCNFELNMNKTRYVPLTKPFRFCKAKYYVTETGKIISRSSRQSVPRARRKLKALKPKIDEGEIKWIDLWTSVNGSLAYLEKYNEHRNVLRLRRMFYSMFGFSCENFAEFRKRDYGITNYIAYRSYNGQNVNGLMVSVRRGTLLESRDGFIYRGRTRICLENSDICHSHFAVNEDNCGLERGDLIANIEFATNVQIGQRPIDHERIISAVLKHRLSAQHRCESGWNASFYAAPINDLYYIAALVGARKGIKHDSHN